MAARILLIDDDELVLKILSSILSDAGYELRTATDGGVGLQEFESFTPDLVITDLVMPDTEGLEMIRAIRRVNATVPIIAISGGGRVVPGDYLKMAAHLGATDTLAKPFLPEQLLEKVRGCLG